MAGRPPVNAMVTAMVNAAKSPIRGATPARIEKAIASGIRASATTSPASTSVRSRATEENAARKEGSTPVGNSSVTDHLQLSSEPSHGERVGSYRNGRVVGGPNQGEQTEPGRSGEPTMKIGEVAERTELSIRSLRHYDELGLVSPSAHSPGGFRLYTETDVERLLLIRRMKPLGFSLERMTDFRRALDQRQSDPERKSVV